MNTLEKYKLQSKFKTKDVPSSYSVEECLTKNHKVSDYHQGLGTLLVCGKVLDVVRIPHSRYFKSCPYCSKKLQFVIRSLADRRYGNDLEDKLRIVK